MVRVDSIPELEKRLDQLNLKLVNQLPEDLLENKTDDAGEVVAGKTLKKDHSFEIDTFAKSPKITVLQKQKGIKYLPLEQIVAK